MKGFLTVLWRSMLITTPLIILVVACTSTNYLKTVSSSGDMLSAVGQSYLDTGATMDQLCGRRIISQDTCDKWSRASKTFQPAYDDSAQAWQSATNERDIKAAAASIVTLSLQLTEYALIAAQQAGGVK